MAEPTKRSPAAGLRKAAILLVSLEPDMAARVMEQVSDVEMVKRLSVEIARLENVSQAERDKILEEFYNLNVAHRYVEQGGVDFARELLEKALPKDEAARIVDTIRTGRESPFRFLVKTPPKSLVAFLREEHSQTIALVLAHLPPEQASAVLKSLPGKKQVEVIRRIATVGPTSPEIVAQVENALQKKMAAVMAEDLKETGGIPATAEILNHLDRNTERSVLESLEEGDPELVNKIRRLMFVFEDLLRVNDRGIQALLKEIERGTLGLALRTASAELKEKFFKNMSKNASALIKEEMEFMGPVRLADVEAAQQSIVEVVRKLEEAGELVVSGRSGAEELVV